MNVSENDVAVINSNFFFKEFTFSKNKFKVRETDKELELADNVIWLDDLLIIYQIKERNNVVDDKDKVINWFNQKVTKKAVKQIKDTLKYFENYDGIVIQNEKGHTFVSELEYEATNKKDILAWFPVKERLSGISAKDILASIKPEEIENYFN